MLFAICYMLYVISGMLFWYMLFVLPVVCRLLRRCWLPSHKNLAALKKFGVCDNKHFDFDFDFVMRRKHFTRVCFNITVMDYTLCY